MAHELIIPGKSDEGERSGYQSAPERAELNDGRYEDGLRPQRLADVVGQQKVLTRLRIILDAARKRNEPLGRRIWSSRVPLSRNLIPFRGHAKKRPYFGTRLSATRLVLRPTFARSPPRR